MKSTATSKLALPKPKDRKQPRKRKNHSRRNKTRERRELELQADKLAREIVYRRDGHRCVKCGTDKGLTPSHIRPRGKCPRMTWMTANILTMCVACHLHWWHKDPIAAGEWLNAKFPGRSLQLLLWERIAPKVDLKETIASLELELAERCEAGERVGGTK